MTTAKTQLCKTWVRVTSVAFVALAAFSAQADTFMFNRGWRYPQNAPFSWSDYPGWWLDLDTGAAPTRAPGEAADVVCLTNNPFLKQMFRVGSNSAAADIETESGIEEFPVNVAKVVEDKINAMSVEELEKGVLTVMKTELKLIVDLGALIGLVIGSINIFI